MTGWFRLCGWLRAVLGTKSRRYAWTHIDGSLSIYRSLVVTIDCVEIGDYWWTKSSRKVTFIYKSQKVDHWVSGQSSTGIQLSMLPMNASPTTISTKTNRDESPVLSIYDKQIAWKQHHQRKVSLWLTGGVNVTACSQNVEKGKAQMSEEERACTFSPKVWWVLSSRSSVIDHYFASLILRRIIGDFTSIKV